MNILNSIETAINNTLTILKIKAEIVITNDLIELTVSKLEEAKKLEKSFSKSFEEVEIFDLAEINEEGFMLNIRY